MTGWTREYVLHHLTWAELIRYLEYAQEWMDTIAAKQAVQIAAAAGFLKWKNPEPEDDGTMTLIRKNQ